MLRTGSITGPLKVTYIILKTTKEGGAVIKKKNLPTSAIDAGLIPG